MNNKKIVVAVSGGFDPLHVGHIRLFHAAKALGDELLVIVNNDHWLQMKKDVIFMPEDERMEIIQSLTPVDRVVLSEHAGNSLNMGICAELEKYRPHIFANGGDRRLDNIPEVDVCQHIGCEMMFNVGHGGKAQSSSWLLKKYFDQVVA